jgi:cell division protein FtsB
MEQKGIKKSLMKMMRNKYIVASVLFFAWIVFFDENSIVSHQQNKQRLNELIEQKEYYKERIVADKQKLEDLKSGVADLEKFAREQYFMSKPDEDVFIVVEK